MSEESEMLRWGGKPQRNSGRGKHSKGDATVGKFLVDIKEYSKSFSINTKFWAKICTDAFQERMEPTLNLVVGEGRNKVRLWVITEDSMLEYLELLNEREENGG